MGRKTVYNKNLTTDEKWNKVSCDNKLLFDEFIEYCASEDKSKETIRVYINGLKIFFCWNVEFNQNKFYPTEIKIKDIIRYQNFLINKKQSPARIRTLKSCISSLSNYIETICFEEYPEFRNIINKVKAPVLNVVRKKTVLSEEDVGNILNKLIERKLYQIACYFSLAVNSGSRKSELLLFKINYFNDKYVTHGLYTTPEKIRTKGRGRLGKLLTKYTIKNDFKPFLDLWVEERKRLNIDSEWLFIGKDNKQAKISTANYWMELITKISGIDCYTHMNRHYFCSKLCKNNIPADVIKDIIGWQNVGLIDTYNDNEVSEQFGDYFSENGIKYIEKKNSI